MGKPPNIFNASIAALIVFASYSDLLFSQEPIEYPPKLKSALEKALILKGASYKPRTEHLLSNGRPKYTNRLILEQSPYLIQHAHNPVDWFTWGSEAFEKAEREGKPIFLSIGYSTCHWCHVMERESFDNTEIARLLNRYFVSIKVDRERRPDVDNTYMTAVMMINGRGGWPMSSFLTADGKTFYGGTYFPREQFSQLLKKIAATWQDDRAMLLNMAERVAVAVAETNASGRSGRQFDGSLIDKAVSEIIKGYDPMYGGFGQAPKFPNEAKLFLLARAWEKGDSGNVAEVIKTTLTQMARGGLYDQIGGGFHRYSTDNKWLIPHFEKMLYNQAHLVRIYLQGYRLTGDWFYKRVVKQTLDYVLREMTSVDGGFYSATDADSEGEEGRFFVWTPEQIVQALGEQTAPSIMELYGVSEIGNFDGHNILHLPEGLTPISTWKNISLQQFVSDVDDANSTLLQVREKRVHPLRDDKIVTAWNGMMISTLAIAGEVLKEPRYVDAAIRCAKFLLEQNVVQDNTLFRVHLLGKSSIPAAQEDYAYLAQALLTLYDVTGQSYWLERAGSVTKKMIADFWDKDTGGFFMNRSKGRLMARPKDSHDGAIPSGNSVALNVLASLARRSSDIVYRRKAVALLSALSGQVARSPESFGYLLVGADDLLNGERGSRQYAALGAISVIGRVSKVSKQGLHLIVDLAMQPGWHINSNQPLTKDLIPTTLALKNGIENWQISEFDYPEPIMKNLGFQREKLALYQGQIRLTAKIDQLGSDNAIVPLSLRLQACNDESCLAPETVNLSVSTANYVGHTR